MNILEKLAELHKNTTQFGVRPVVEEAAKTIQQLQHQLMTIANEKHVMSELFTNLLNEYKVIGEKLDVMEKHYNGMKNCGNCSGPCGEDHAHFCSTCNKWEFRNATTKDTP